ncbi:ECF-type sigma factor [Rudaea sp.]|uniref:ECF-type sigma factor n=1 Tax=Rudaea sp. TaxID=2136325 RepID=UPI003220956A
MKTTRASTGVFGGDAEALRRLFARVYDELKRLARIQLAKAGGQTLNTTGLVHEAYLKLAQSGESSLHDREHFFSLAARAMRQIVVDRARAQLADKRGGGAARMTDIDEAFDIAGGELGPEALLRLNEALDRFASEEPRLAQLVELRFFAGLDLEQIAVLQQVSERTLNHRDGGGLMVALSLPTRAI